MNPTPHEALLEHRTFLLRLARSLVRDESTAEDVVQEASAAYLASPPRDVLSSRAWLAQVVRRMAGKSHRARARAAAREAAVARPDLEPNPTDETDRQLDAQATLIQFLQALPETQREAVKLRYHDDLSPKAIAKRLGVPVSTVHSRLQRALGKLRIEMDRSAGGQRDQWAAALLPASTKLAVAGAAGAAGGSVTAPSALPWVLGAVAATVLAGIYLLPGNEPEAPAKTSLVATVEANEIPTQDLSPPNASEPDASRGRAALIDPSAPPTAESQGGGNWLVPVTVTGPGVEVKPTTLRIKGALGNYHWPDDKRIELSLDAPGQGEIDLRDVVAAWTSRFSAPIHALIVEVDHPDCPMETLTFPVSIEARDEEPAEATSISFDLPRSCVVTGRVEFQGAPLPEPVLVIAFPLDPAASPPQLLDGPHLEYETVREDGSFRLRMAHDGPVAVVTLAIGYRPETRLISIRRGETRALPTVALDEGFCLEGRMTWAGSPAPAGTQLRLETVARAETRRSVPPSELGLHSLRWADGRMELGRVYATLDADGVFRVAGLDDEPRHVYLSDMPEVGTYSRTRLAEAAPVPSTLAIDLDAALMEVSFDFGGSAPADGELESRFILPKEHESPQGSQFRERGGIHMNVYEGAPLRLAVFPGMEVELTAKIDGFAETTVRHLVTQAAGETLALTIPVRTPDDVTTVGVRLTVDGEPLEEGTTVQLEAMPCGSSDSRERVDRNAKVTEGVATFGTLPVGCFNLNIYPARSSQWRSSMRVDAKFTETLEANRHVELAAALAPGGKALFTARTASGRLVGMQWHARVLDENGAEVPTHFRTMRPGVNTTYGGWTGHGEAERLSPFPVGHYTLELRHPDHAPVDHPFVIEANAVTRVDVELTDAE